jgi:hypothetical protein
MRRPLGEKSGSKSMPRPERVIRRRPLVSRQLEAHLLLPSRRRQLGRLGHERRRQQPPATHTSQADRASGRARRLPRRLVTRRDAIVYTSDVNGDRELFLMNADGSGQHRLTRFRGADGAEAWLPDGRIVFAHFHGDEPLPHWYLIRADGTQLQALPQLYGAGDPI